MVSAAAPIFIDDVDFYVSWVILIPLVIIQAVAFVNCLTQRADAFPVVGSLSKNTWSLILGAALVLSVLCAYTGSQRSFFSCIAIIAAGVYMLDVRPALKDATDGTGSW